MATKILYEISSGDITELENKHASATVNGKILEIGDELRAGDIITAKTNAGWAFFNGDATSNVSSIYFICEDPFMGDIEYKGFTLSESDTIATFNMVDVGNLKYIGLAVSTKAGDIPLPKSLYTVSVEDVEQLTVNEVSANVNGVPIVAGSVLRLGDVVTAVISGNRNFYVHTETPEISSIYFTCEDFLLGDIEYRGFELSNNNQTAVFTMSDVVGGFVYKFWNISTKIETPDVVGANNVYEIDYEKLTQINQERFTTYAGRDDPFDYGQYILSVLEFPFTIPSEIIGGPANIQLADKTLTVAGVKLLDDSITVDMGVITVPEKVGNLLDYVKTKAVLHLPRSPSIVLDLEYVIGQTLGIFYILDAYTGTATINVTSTKLDGVVSSNQVDIGVKVPYMANAYSQPENTGVVAGGANGVLTPYVEIIRNESILSNGFFTAPIVDESLIGAQSGFVKIDNVDLICSALSDEKARIISALANGVIIK